MTEVPDAYPALPPTPAPYSNRKSRIFTHNLDRIIALT